MHACLLKGTTRLGALLFDEAASSHEEAQRLLVKLVMRILHVPLCIEYRPPRTHENSPFSSAECRLHGAHQRWVQGPEFWHLTVRRSRRNGEPLGRVGQVQHLREIEFGVVAKARRGVGCSVSFSQDGELTAMQRCRSLAGAVCYANVELRRVVVKHDKN